MKKRIPALLLAAALLTGLISGCSRPAGGDSPQPDASTSQSAGQSTQAAGELAAKYAYLPSYLSLPDGVDTVSAWCVSGNTLFFSASVQSGTATVPTGDGGSDTGPTYTPRLYRLALDGSGCTQIGAYLPDDSVQPSETVSVSTDIPVLCTAPDGSVWALEQTGIYDSGAEVDSFNAGHTQRLRLLHFSADGALVKEVSLENGSLDPSAVDTGDTYIDKIFADSNGFLYLCDWTNAAVLDTDGNVLGTVDIADYGTLCTYSADRIGILDYSTTGKAFRTLDPKTQTFSTDTLPVPADAWSLTAGDEQYDLYYEKDGNLYGWHADTGVSEKLVDWLACDIDSTDIQGTKFLPDGRVFAVSYNHTSGSAELILLSRVDASGMPEKKELTLACMNLDWTLRGRIIEFNRQSADYRIVVKDYAEYSSTDITYSGDYVTATQSDDGLTKLNTEILAGNVPDILITDSLPVRQYAAKGLLEDLWTYIDNDPSLSRDSFVSEVLSANEMDGKLYELPAGFSLVTAAGLDKIVGSYDSWTLDDLNDAMTKLQPNATVFNVDVTKSAIMTYILYMNADSFVDWETKTAHFDSQEFIDLLNFTNTFPADFDFTTFDFADYESDATRMLAGKQLLTIQSSLYGFDSVYQQFAQLNDDLRFIGMPSRSGHDGNAFMLSSGLAISSTCKDKDAAWSLIRTLVSGEYQSGDLWCFPILKSAFDASAAAAMEQEYVTDENGNQVLDDNGEPIKVSKGGFSNGDGPMIELYAMTQEQYDVVLELIHSTHKIMRYDTSLMDIINAETGSFFAGETSAEETAARIQNRVQLYIAEQG